MSYLRGKHYLWSDGTRLHVWVADGYDGWNESGWAEGMKCLTPLGANGSSRRKHPSGVSIPEKIMDQFVVMRFAEMLVKGTVSKAIERGLTHRGNSGAATLAINAAKLQAALEKIKFAEP